MTDSLKHGFVVSDLHLFTHRSTAHHYVTEMHAAAGMADFFVLNGDIFDFRWSTHADVTDTSLAAIDWLHGFAAEFPKCQVFYIMGNHDCPAPFATYLDELTSRQPNFRWHSSHLRIGNSLFLHGDLLLDGSIPDPFQRKLAEVEDRKGRHLHFAYQVLVASRLHRFCSLLHTPAWCAKRALRSLRQHHPGLAEGLKHIYFGHIHRVFSNFEHDGIVFHNTGSTVRGLDANVLAVRT